MLEAAKNPSILPKGFTLPEITLPAVLPTDAAALTALLHTVLQKHDASNLKALNYISHLFEQFLLARRRMFGSSSEQSSAQGRLFDEAEALAEGSTGAQDVAPILAQPAASEGKDKPARGKRGPLPPELERVEIVHDVPESERSCCGTPMGVIGQDVSEQLDIVPMQVRVLRHIRLRYGCPNSTHAPVTAKLPPQPVPKSNASADFLAMMLTVKFVDGLPLTRFGKVLGRHHAPVPVQTLARWAIGSSHVLQPLFNLARDALFDGAFIHIGRDRGPGTQGAGQEADIQQLYVGPDRRPARQAGRYLRLRSEPQRRGAGAIAAGLSGLSDDRWVRWLQ